MRSQVLRDLRGDGLPLPVSGPPQVVSACHSNVSQGLTQINVSGLNISCMNNADYAAMVQSIWDHERKHYTLAEAEAKKVGNDLWKKVEPYVYNDEQTLRSAVFEAVNLVNNNINNASQAADNGTHGPYQMWWYDPAVPGTWYQATVTLSGTT